jgi:hypothetical protein
LWIRGVWYQADKKSFRCFDRTIDIDYEETPVQKYFGRGGEGRSYLTQKLFYVPRPLLTLVFMVDKKLYKTVTAWLMVSTSPDPFPQFCVC